MTVRSVRLDFTLSAPLYERMAESPRKLNFFTAHIVANMSVGPFVSTTEDIPYPNVLTYMLSTFSAPVASNIFQHEIVTL